MNGGTSLINVSTLPSTQPLFISEVKKFLARCPNLLLKDRKVKRCCIQDHKLYHKIRKIITKSYKFFFSIVEVFGLVVLVHLHYLLHETFGNLFVYEYGQARTTYHRDSEEENKRSGQFMII